MTGSLGECRALTSSHQEVTGLEQRLSKAEQSEGEALRELREAESALVDQQALLLRAAALEDKLKESRAEQGQLHNYKQVSDSGWYAARHCIIARSIRQAGPCLPFWLSVCLSICLCSLPTGWFVCQCVVRDVCMYVCLTLKYVRNTCQHASALDVC